MRSLDYPTSLAQVNKYNQATQFGFTLKTATKNGMYVHVLENAKAYSRADSRSSPHEKQCPNCESANSCSPPDADTLK